MVYVDDFKMGGPAGEAMKEGWELIRSGITMDDPTPVGQCLGCKHVVSEHVIDGKKVRAMEYGVCDFMKKSVTADKEACRKPNMELKRVDTPFIQTTDGEGGDAPHPLADGGGGTKGVLAPIASAILM